MRFSRDVVKRFCAKRCALAASCRQGVHKWSSECSSVEEGNARSFETGRCCLFSVRVWSQQVCRPADRFQGAMPYQPSSPLARGSPSTPFCVTIDDARCSGG
jgi:hypothetical protein